MGEEYLGFHIRDFDIEVLCFMKGMLRFTARWLALSFTFDILDSFDTIAIETCRLHLRGFRASE